MTSSIACPARGLVGGVFIAIAFVFAAAAGAASPHATVAQIGRQFDSHALVMIGELHRSREIHAFLQELLHDRAFICRADDVVVEFGNSRLQHVADAYTAGEDIGAAQLQSLWRETAVPLTWNSPLYQQVYEAVRGINRRHLCAHALRIVLADPPLDWSKVHAISDYAPFTDRDGSYAAVVEREVLAKGHHALLIAGELHALKTLPEDMQDDPAELTAAQLIERRHPGALFSIVTVPLPNAAQALRMGAPPSFRVVHGTDLEGADFQFTDWQSTVTPVVAAGKRTWRLVPDKRWPRMGAAVDGLLYVGGNHSVYPPPTIYLDPVYRQELRRRAAIIKAYSGQDFIRVIDDLVKQAETQTPPH